MRVLNVRDKELGNVRLEFGEEDLKLKFPDLPGPKQIGAEDLTRMLRDLSILSSIDLPNRSLCGRIVGVLGDNIPKFEGGGGIVVSESNPEISFGFQPLYDERISKFLLDNLKDHSFILVGERHGPEQDPLRYAVAKSLPRLKSEGLTHLAVEFPSTMQRIIDGLDYSSPNILDSLRALNIAGWSDGNLEIVIAAKKAGLKVLCIDLAEKPSAAFFSMEPARWHNKRDKWMQRIIDGELAPKWMRLKKMLGMDASPTGKMLVFIGSGHLPHLPFEQDVDYARYGEHVTRIGPRLIKKYGRKEVADTRLEFYRV